MYTLAALFSSLLTLSRSCQPPPPFSFRLFVVSLSLLPIYSQSLDKHFFLLVPTWIRLSMLFSSLIPHAPTTTSTVRRLFPLLLLYTHDDTHNRDHCISLRVASSGWQNKADAFSLLFFFFSSSYSLSSFFYRLSEAMFDLLCGDDNK